MFTIDYLRTKVDTTFSAFGDDAKSILHSFVDSIEKDVHAVEAGASLLMKHGFLVASSDAVGVVGSEVRRLDDFASEHLSPVKTISPTASDLEQAKANMAVNETLPFGVEEAPETKQQVAEDALAKLVAGLPGGAV